MSCWTFLSNHAHVVLLLSRNNDLRVRDLARRIGITERAVQRIISDLVADGYLRIEKNGRRNHYILLDDQPLRHSVEEGATVRDLVDLVDRNRP